MARGNRRKVVSRGAVLRPVDPAASKGRPDSHSGKVQESGDGQKVLPDDEDTCPNCGRPDSLIVSSFSDVAHCGCYYMRRSKENPVLYSCFDASEVKLFEELLELEPNW